ncbi:MAG: hypothetical protein Q3X94_01455, partial [Oscillospiraceae bacterium]|nr:hypothetical protein [Oscillospiraceae bacterium]
GKKAFRKGKWDLKFPENFVIIEAPEGGKPCILDKKHEKFQKKVAFITEAKLLKHAGTQRSSFWQQGNPHGREIPSEELPCHG